ncbi:hypothetical protein [Bradyrhizobium genosp. A]|uniref:hypothetical protein n=1 Tax=Bradyrhizobium genosp. A TaxID=83626 RepID=UPI003CFB9600
MEVITPLDIVEFDPPIGPLEQMRLIGFIFQHQMNLAANQLAAHGLGKFDEEVLVGIVLQGMDGIEPQPIDPIVTQPQHGVIGQKTLLR